MPTGAELMLEPPACSQSGSFREHYFPGVPDRQWNDWKWQYAHRVRDLDTLSSLLPYPDEERCRLAQAGDLHIGIPPYYFSLMDPSDPSDPIRRQAVPSESEYEFHRVGVDDPLDEDTNMPVEGLVHKYPDRALFIATNMCPLYCRHCTRRREWQDGEMPKPRRMLEEMLEYIRRTPSIHDVLLSGGDPLSLPLSTLEFILSELGRIAHVDIVRICTRYPVVLPQRFTGGLLDLLSKHAPLWMSTHFNHPRELTPEAARACQNVVRAGVPINNQSVLLKGVNDSPETIMELCRGLLKMNVRPYYLFQCDPIRGAEHLRTPIAKGIEILEHLRGRISGFAIPAFVVDLGEGGKVPVGPDYVMEHRPGEYIFRNYEGRLYRYPDPPGRGAGPEAVR